MTPTAGPAPANHNGYSLVELLMVAVLGAVLMLSLYGLLAQQQRAYAIQASEISTQQSARAALEMLVTEFRSLDASGGDLIAMDNDTISVRVMRSFGVACAVSYSPTSVSVPKRGDWFSSSDSVFIYADGDEDIASDDEWIATQMGTVDTTQSCGGEPAQLIPLPTAAAQFAADSVRMGAPVRSFERYSFGLGTYGSHTYLGRWNGASQFLPLVGPLDASSGPALLLEYFDINGLPTVVPTEVHRIDVMVRAESKVTRPTGGFVADSLTASVFTRN